MIIKRGLLAILMLVFIVDINRAGEGMWIPLLLKQLNESEMQMMGMKITAEDIYSINHSGMKDAIVRFGGGCTGVIVSGQGLLLTNHHCGYGSIHRHSTLENDYLTDGFWAMSLNDELPNPGLTVMFIVRMEDVTQQILQGVSDTMTEAERAARIDENSTKIVDVAVEGTHYDAVVKPFYYGNEYYLFITETFKDIRLVGAPPSNIGKFGGDTDNWMWPRHTGDFSVFRIYADSNNLPAEFSPDNVPYTPKYYVPVSLAGVDEGDFTMVFGFPGRTQEYLPSFAIENITEITNPATIKLRQKRIDIMNEEMFDDREIRLKYASKLAGAANYWKKMIGENRGIQKLDAISKKQQLEEQFAEWAQSSELLKQKYGKLLPGFEEIYKAIRPLELSSVYIMEGGLGIEIVDFASDFSNLVNMSKMKDISKVALMEQVNRLKEITEKHFNNYHQPIDEKVFINLMHIYSLDVPLEGQPDIFRMISEKFGNNFIEYTGYVFDKSMFAKKETTLDFLEKYKKGDYKKIERDPAFEIYTSLRNYYVENLQQQLSFYDAQLDSLQRIYMKALMEFQQNKRFYPDANSTLRVHYGQVDDYFPRDAVHYDYYTTLTGIMEKENPDIYDYVVEDKLKELYNSKDYGMYADQDGEIHVCFTASNHTTGGNSGSPVFNAEGQLIGLNFDRNWEGTMSDLMYDPDQCRNITLDIRYLLFIMDKYAGAGHLVEEMELVH